MVSTPEVWETYAILHFTSGDKDKVCLILLFLRFGLF